MNIAIVDDSLEDRQAARQLLQTFFSEKAPQLLPKIHFHPYNSAENFLESFTPGYFALVILDIYMQDITGMEAAKHIADLDKQCLLIFLTTSIEHILDGYSVHAAGYILKPLVENSVRFYQTMDYCLEQLKLDNSSLEVTVDSAPLAVPLREIYYVDCNNNRTVVLHLATKELRTANTYQHCLEQLQQHKQFLECYHRLLVNMEHIEEMNEDTFLLFNNAQLPISRRKKNEVKQAYLLYLTNR